MPHCVPGVRCFNTLYDGLLKANLLNRSGHELLGLLDNLADVDANWPVPIDDDCPNDEGAIAIAIALALLWPPGMWNASEAQEEFKAIDVDLTGAEPLRQTVDHVAVSGMRRRWAPAIRVLESSLLGDIFNYRGPVGAAIRYLRGYPVEDQEGQFDGLIPDLDARWGCDFREDGNSHAGILTNRLLQPFVVFHPDPGSDVKFAWDDVRPDEVVVMPFFPKKPVPVGSRRNYRLASGTGELLKNGIHFAFVPSGQRLILRVLDDCQAELQLAYRRGSNVAGRKLMFQSTDDVRLRFTGDDPSIFEAWNCTCGALDCDQKHRLSAWNPRTMNDGTTLASFLATAVKGPDRTMRMNVFIQGMYYALLCNGE